MSVSRTITLGLLLLLFSTGLSSAQEPPKSNELPPDPKDRLEIPPNVVKPMLPVRTPSALDMRRRLVELDRLLTLGSTSRAETLLKDLEKHSLLKRELVTRRIKLAQLKGDHPEAVRLCREALVDQDLNPGLWRSLAESQLAVDEPDSALESISHFIATNPNGRSATMVGVDLLQSAGQQAMGVALIDSMRIILGEPTLLGRQRAVGLLLLDRQKEAADEVSRELRSNPFNLSLMRSDLLQGPYRPADHATFMKRLTKRSGEKGAQGAEVLLVANLLVATGEVAAALDLVDPLVSRRGAVMSLLQNSALLVRELELMGDSDQLQPSVDYLLAVLERLSGPVNQDQVMRLRAADQLALVCEIALEVGALGDDPHQAADRFARLLALVREVNPNSESLYSSQIRLAAFTRDVLHDPTTAARRLERLLLNLDLPTSGVALVRLTLGDCYLAAGDTARGRVVLDNLGRDPEFHQAAGHAHFLLARLDLAQGHFGMSRDRFAVVALDNPGAPYANDALDLGLAVAEEMENPSGGPSILTLYAPSVYFDLTARPTEHQAALEDFVTRAAALVDLDEPQHLLERGRFELADLYRESGQFEQALAMLDLIVVEHPDGRYPARALEMRGLILQDSGQTTAARNAWERLLSQYPEYLFIDDVRDELRTLP